MTFSGGRFAAALALVSLFAVTADGQGRDSHLGPRVSYQLDLEELGLGAQLSLPLSGGLDFYPSLDNFFVNSGSYWSFNVDMKAYLFSRTTPWLYLGAGVNVAQRRIAGFSNNETGLNLFGGVEGQAGRIHPFAEFRFTTSDGSTSQISAGLNITM
jgi:hypothetical protein